MKKKTGLIFDLDQTLIDSSTAETLRSNRKWSQVYDLIGGFSLYPGMDKIFEYISEEEIPYCIVTSSPGTYCKKVCTHWKFDHGNAVSFFDTSKRKPEPDPILLAVQRLGINHDRILSFGDRDIDIIASQKAGVKSVACLWGAADTKILLDTKPDYVVKTPGELKDLIANF